jgi:hypothetical protein
VQAEQDGPRQGDAEPIVDQPVERARGERSEQDALGRHREL